MAKLEINLIDNLIYVQMNLFEKAHQVHSNIINIYVTNKYKHFFLQPDLK